MKAKTKTTKPGNGAVIYCRVSTSEQTENHSLATQEKACKEYCLRRGITLERVFVEEGQSAKTINRTEFQKMLNYCFQHKEKLQYVVVYSVSRFARSVLDHSRVRNQLRDLGIELRSVTEGFDETSTGKLMESMMASFAQFDNDARGERTVVGMKAALEAGQWPFRPPLGYLRGNSRAGASIFPDPVRGPLIRKAFEMFAEGAYTKREVLDHVTKLGLTNSAGKKVNLQTFILTLTRPIYTGLMAPSQWQEMKPIKGDFEPLVSEDLFNKVQWILVGRKSPTVPHLRSHPDFPLRHFVRCGHCGKPLTGSWSKNRKKVAYGYYRCYAAACKAVNVKREKLEKAFLDYLETLRPCKEFLALFEAVVMDVWEENRVGTITMVASLESQVKALEQKRELLEEAFLYKRAIDENTYQRHRGKLAAELTTKQIELSEAQIEEFDIEGAISYARQMLENAASLWKAFSHDQKERFQRVIFPEGLNFADGKFGTTITNPIFSHLREGMGVKEEMATRHGFEP